MLLYLHHLQNYSLPPHTHNAPVYRHPFYSVAFSHCQVSAGESGRRLTELDEVQPNYGKKYLKVYTAMKTDIDRQQVCVYEMFYLSFSTGISLHHEFLNI